jgi:GntR family transcriptional regulator
MVTRNAPLANQLSLELANQISTGALGEADGRLPSEAELSERYAVSRATIREALAKLESAGIVTRRHGSGTFINRIVRNRPGLIWGWLNEAPAFVDLIAHSGHTAASRVLRIAVLAAAETPLALDLTADAQAVRIEKLFVANDTPVIHSATAIPRAFIEPGAGPTLARDEYEKTTYQLLEAQSGRRVHHQESDVRAVAADDDLAAVLRVPPGAPLLEVEEVGYDLEQAPLFHAIHHFRGDLVSFRQIRTPSFTIERP